MLLLLMTSLLLVAAFFLSALVRPRANWRAHLRLTRSSPYLERLKHFVGALIKLVIWIAFLELVLRVWDHTLVEVTHSSVNGKRIADGTELIVRIRALKVGDTVTLSRESGGDVTVVLGSQAAD